jgi:uncharacterized protein
VTATTTVFRVSVGVAALHALVAAFVTPNPGTTAGDHIVAGLAPAAAALAAGAAYPRLPGGVRALLALGCGAPALAAGAVLAPSVAALAGAAAGVALLALAVVEGVRAGRRAGPLRTLGGGVVAAVATLFVVAPLTLAVVATHRPGNDAALIPGRPVTLRTADGLRLTAAYTPSRNRAAVVVVPGRGRAAATRARMLARHGYGVLVLDRRGEGGSQGDPNARGWGGEPDVAAAVDWLRGRPEVDPARVAGVGLSVGGELLLQAAANDRGLRAVVSEGAGMRSVAEQRHWPGVAPLLRWASPMVVETAAIAVLGGTGVPPDLADLSARIAPRPVLLIRALHGNEDEVLNRVYRRAAPASTQLWELRRGGHVGALAAAPAAYERRVAGFLDRALAP